MRRAFSALLAVLGLPAASVEYPTPSGWSRKRRVALVFHEGPRARVTALPLNASVYGPHPLAA